MQAKRRLATSLMTAIGMAGVWLAPSAGLAQDTGVAPSPDNTRALQSVRAAYLDQPLSVVTFRSMNEFAATREVARGTNVWQLPRADAALDFSYEFDGQRYSADAFLERTFTNALIIIKDGRIVYENYLNMGEASDRYIGFSMSKSVTSLLVGCAVADGLIRSVDDRVDRYLPELRGGGYEGVTIRQLLNMRSGIEYTETYIPSAWPRGTPIASPVDYGARYVDAAPHVGRRRRPGSQFEYMNLDTAVLGWLVERVSNSTISAYASRRLWEPMGAEYNGYFVLDGPTSVGRELNLAGFNASLRDWARVGLLMLNEGRANGRQVVPESWVRDSLHNAGGDSEISLGYGYQWWLYPNSRAFSARGHLGQFVFVDPDTRTVIVKLSFFPGPQGLGMLADPNDTSAQAQLARRAPTESLPYTRETEAFFRAASAWSPH
jgi:CubicO group peptidase (beta-lactamase class C family)